MLNQKMDHRLDELAEKITKRDTINRELYAKYDVKTRPARCRRHRRPRRHYPHRLRHGLRKIDGKSPMEGDLLYRGYSVKDMVKDFKETNRFGYEEVAYTLLFGNLPSKKI